MRNVIALSALCAGMAAFSASADTICVNPTGSGACESSIQAAVDLADAADIIKIAPGTYREAVTVPANLNGLILQGGSAKTTVIDPNASLIDPGLAINSNDVQVIGIGVNNSNTVGILVNGTGFVMKKSQVQNAENHCVEIMVGTTAVIEGNRFFSCDGDAVHVVAGDGITFTKNRIISTDGGGLFVDDGDGLIAESNVCENVGGDCIEVDGNGAIITKNSGNPVSDRTVNVDGTNALIEGNIARGSGGVVTVDNTSNTQVIKNTAIDSDGKGVFLRCDTIDCAGTLIEGNTVTLTQDDGDCFDFEFEDFGGAIVMKNKGLKCDGSGVEVSGDAAATIEGNTITRAGSHDGDGFNIRGSGVKRVVKNKTQRAGGDGFDIDDAAHVLEDNQSKNNARNGFIVRDDADGTAMTGNQSTGNGEEGIENRATGLVLTDNTASGNSLDMDFCNSLAAGATFTEGVVGSNDFGTTTPPDEAEACLND